MATIQRIEGKNSVSYKITVHCGYDQEYRKIRHYKTWRVPDGWSVKRADKEAQKIALEFEQSLSQGYLLDNRQTFREYAEYVIDLKEQAGLKHNTVRLYRFLLERITPTIGHMKLVDIRPQHLNALYQSLQQKGVRYTSRKVHTKVDLGTLLQAKQLSRASLAETAGISHTTVTSACRGERILQEKAEQIAQVLNEDFADLFATEQSDSRLSSKTIKEYHRFIRVVLGQAEREMLVPYNAAAKATPPKSKAPEPNFFQPHEIEKILEALESEPLKWRTITHLLIVTGCRRGEIMGLKWSKLDLDEQRIKIDSNLLYSKERGVYEGSTKTENVRFLQIPKETVDLLNQYRVEQDQIKLANGDRWNDLDFVFTQDDGRPMNPSSITAWLTSFSKRHGLRHINPHAFRHSVASILIANGTDVVTVSKQLGHTKPGTTDNFYAHLIKEEKAKASECIADVMLRQGRTKGVR